MGAVADFQNSEYPFNLVERLFPDIDIKTYRRQYNSSEEVRATFSYFLNLFPEQTAKAFILRFDTKLTYEQIGKALGISKARAAQIIAAGIGDFVFRRRKYKVALYQVTEDVLMNGVLEAQKNKWYSKGRAEGENAVLISIKKALAEPDMDIDILKKMFLDENSIGAMKFRDFTAEYYLSSRCRNAVQRRFGTMVSMEEICKCSEKEIRHLRGFGEATYSEFVNALKKAGLSLRKDEE